jgi:L-ascorbate metabolism protein UlaG (beta-lactamase superfamily)
LEITLLGHNCLRLRGRDAAVLTDPFVPAEGSLRTSADMVTFSNSKESDGRLVAIDGTPRAVCGPGEYEIKGVFITGVSTYRDAQSGKERGRNTVYVIELEDLRVCHLGELGHVLSSDQLEEIGTVDVLCVPVRGAPGISPAQAAEVISQLEPSIILPMDWTGPDDSQVTATFDKFCHEMGIKEPEPQPRLNVSKSSLPAEAQVVVLEPKR